MNNFPLDQIFDPELLLNDDISSLSFRSKKLYGDWILDLRKGKTFFGLNWNWPSTFDSDISGFYDTYVFSWHVEDWPHAWLKDFCESHPDSQVIVLGEFSLCKNYYHLPNLKSLVHHCWHLLIPEVLQFDSHDYVPMHQRKQRLSSLVNKPSYFKSLTTAYLLKNYLGRDFIFSWNINLRKEICPSMNFLDEQYMTRREIIELCKFYHEQLKDKKHTLDNFNDTRFSNYYSSIPAYTDCLVNISNETYTQSFINGINLPGPFITDKTWKPLLAGCALLSQGSKGVYAYLEKFGFIFDYPWDNDYDLIDGDIDRYIAALEKLDDIFNLDFCFLANQLDRSTRYNYDYIRSHDFIKKIQLLNEKYFSDFYSNY